MSIHRRATRRDKNEDAIVSALEAAGASVTRLGVEGVPDLLVGIEGRTYLLEVKAPLGARGGVHSNSTSLKSRGGDGVRTAAQVAWWAAWRGAPPVIVRTPAEALEAIGARVEAREADRAQLAAAGFAYDPAYRAWVRRQPCAARALPGHRCDGPIEGDHTGRRAMGRKADDATMIALCQLAHQQRDAFHGAFSTFDHDGMRAWLDAQVADHQARYARAATARPA